MEREKSRTKTFLIKFLFTFLIVIISGYAIFWAAKSIFQINLQFSGAADAVSEVGIIAHGIASYAHKQQFAKDKEAYAENIKNMKILIRKMELRHLSLIRGNPIFNVQEEFKEDIAAIYQAAPIKAIKQVGMFLERANLLIQIPRREYNKNNTHLTYIASAVKGNLINAISKAIRAYRLENERRISRIILILLGSLLGLIVMALTGFVLVFLGKEIEEVKFEPKIPSGSISTVLKEISVEPESGKAELPIFSKKNLVARM